MVIFRFFYCPLQNSINPGDPGFENPGYKAVFPNSHIHSTVNKKDNTEFVALPSYQMPSILLDYYLDDLCGNNSNLPSDLCQSEHKPSELLIRFKQA